MEFSIFFFLILEFCPLKYPKFVQTFQIGAKCTINFHALASFQNNNYFKIFFQKIQHKILLLEI